MGNYQILKGMQKSAAQDDYIVFYFYRKISIFFSLLFIKLRFHPNMVNFFALFADLFALYKDHLNNMPAEDSPYYDMTVNIIDTEPLSIDTITEETGLPVQKVSSLLMGLELKELIVQHAGKGYIRKL